MVDRLLTQVLLLQEYMIFVVAVGIVCLIFASILSIRLSINGKILKVMGIFYNLSNRLRGRLATGFLRFLFVVWCICFKVEMELAHFAMLIALCAFGAILSANLKDITLSTVWSILVGVGMTAGNLLLAYNSQVRYEWTIELIYWLLGIFIIFYSLYLFIREVGEISAERKN